MISPYQDMATHTHLPLLSPRGFCVPLAAAGRGTGASSPAAQSPSAPILLRALSTCRVYVGPTAHGDSSVPPTLTARAVESFRAALSLQLGPRERNKGAIFISSLVGSGEKGQEKRPVFAKHNNRQEIFLWLFEAGFFFSLFLFLKRAGTASGQFKNNQALASHFCHMKPFLG